MMGQSDSNLAVCVCLSRNCYFCNGRTGKCKIKRTNIIMKVLVWIMQIMILNLLEIPQSLRLTNYLTNNL